MFELLVIGLLLMLVTGASFTALAKGLLKGALRLAALGLFFLLLFQSMSGLTTRQGLWVILIGGAVLLVIEEVVRHRYNRAHPDAPIGFDGKVAGE